MAASIKCDERPFRGGVWWGFASEVYPPPSNAKQYKNGKRKQPKQPKQAKASRSNQKQAKVSKGKQ